MTLANWLLNFSSYSSFDSFLFLLPPYLNYTFESANSNYLSKLLFAFTISVYGVKSSCFKFLIDSSSKAAIDLNLLEVVEESIKSCENESIENFNICIDVYYLQNNHLLIILFLLHLLIYYYHTSHHFLNMNPCSANSNSSYFKK